MMDWRSYSRLPDDPAYWQALADRIERTRAGVHVSLRAPAIMAALATAAAILVFALPAHDEKKLPMLAPVDPLGRVMLAAQEPPGLTQLLASDNEDTP